MAMTRTKRSVILDMDGFECSREDIKLKYHDYTAFLAWKSRSWLRPKLEVPLWDENYDRFFFPIEISWSYFLEQDLMPCRHLFAFPFKYNDLTGSGKWKLFHLLTTDILPEYDKIFSMKSKGYKSVSAYNNTTMMLELSSNFIYYKGGHYERSVARALGLPSQNLEEYGVPKLEQTSKYIEMDTVVCPLHEKENPHCPMVEVMAHNNYMKRNNIIPKPDLYID